MLLGLFRASGGNRNRRMASSHRANGIPLTSPPLHGAGDSTESRLKWTPLSRQFFNPESVRLFPPLFVRVLAPVFPVRLPSKIKVLERDFVASN